MGYGRERGKRSGDGGMYALYERMEEEEGRKKGKDDVRYKGDIMKEMRARLMDKV